MSFSLLGRIAVLAARERLGLQSYSAACGRVVILQPFQFAG